jgi:hypothetical protein
MEICTAVFTFSPVCIQINIRARAWIEEREERDRRKERGEREKKGEREERREMRETRGLEMRE